MGRGSFLDEGFEVLEAGKINGDRNIALIENKWHNICPILRKNNSDPHYKCRSRVLWRPRIDDDRVVAVKEDDCQLQLRESGQLCVRQSC